MALYQSSIHHQPPEFDGTRISVMSSHVLAENWRLPDPRIVEKVTYDKWWPELAPPMKVVGDYYNKRITLEKLFEIYEMCLRTEVERQDRIHELVEMALAGNALVMCDEDDHRRCHRSVLLDVIEEHYPGVVIFR